MSEQVKQLSHKGLIELVTTLEARIAKLEEQRSKSASDREMTDADAERVTYGDLSEKSHKDAAKELNLSYGQVYSARLEFTFKAVHKSAREAGKTNRWAK